LLSLCPYVVLSVPTLIDKSHQTVQLTLIFFVLEKRLDTTKTRVDARS